MPEYIFLKSVYLIKTKYQLTPNTTFRFAKKSFKLFYYEESS